MLLGQGFVFPTRIHSSTAEAFRTCSERPLYLLRQTFQESMGRLKDVSAGTDATSVPYVHRPPTISALPAIYQRRFKKPGMTDEEALELYVHKPAVEEEELGGQRHSF